MLTFNANQLLSQRLSLLRAIGITLLALLLLFSYPLELELAYTNLILIGIAWLLLHIFVTIGQHHWQITANTLMLQLFADLTIVTSLLAFSGGIHNPFFALLLLPLLLTVGILPLKSQYALLFAILCAASLLILAPITHTNADKLPPIIYATLFQLEAGIINNTPFNPMDMLEKIGLWLNIMLIASLTALFLARLHQQLQQQQIEINAAKQHHQEQQHLLQLGLNAAATAHDLSTPLATISLLASEAKDAFHHNSPQEAEQALTQIQRLVKDCKARISQTLLQQSLDRKDNIKRIRWTDYLEQQLEHWKALKPQHQITLNILGQGDIPEMIELPALNSALISLLNNAADADHLSAQLHLNWTSEKIMLCLINDGVFSQEILMQFPMLQQSTKATGHGVGLMLAYNQINSLGGTLSINNINNQQAKTCIQLPKNWQIW